jgi:hypothetical protein
MILSKIEYDKCKNNNKNKYINKPQAAIRFTYEILSRTLSLLSHSVYYLLYI